MCLGAGIANAVLQSTYWTGDAVSERRDLLAIQTIVITFIAAVRALDAYASEPDLRTMMVDHARARAVHLLDGVEKHLPYEADSVLDRSIRQARRRIESP